MDAIEPVQVCWTQAVQRFNETLTPESKKRINILNPGDRHQLCNIHDLLDSALEAQRKCSASRRSIRNFLEAVVKAANRYAPVIDVLVQPQPDIVALVWGAIRLLINIAAAEIETGQEVRDSLVLIVQHAGRYQEEARLFAKFDRVQQAITSLFVQILNYLVRAKSYFQKPYAVRFAKAGLLGSRPRFKVIIATIHDQAASLDREIRTASETAHANHREALIAHSRVVEKEFALEQAFRVDCRGDSCRQIDLLTRILAEQDSQNTRGEEMYRMLARDAPGLFQGGEQGRASPIQLSSIVEWLRNRSTLLKHIPGRAQGTCEWIFGHPAYRSWCQSDYSSCLWISGIPGCGKTVLASYIVERTTTETVLTYFFRNSSERSATLASPFAASLLATLCQHTKVVQDPSFSRVIARLLPLFTNYECASECPFDKLVEILDSVLELVPVYTLVVDALDECSDTDNTELLFNFLRKLGTRSNARVILLSRHHPKVEDFFGLSHQVHMNQCTVEPDILHFIKQDIARSPRLRALEQAILTKAMADSQGMFLWANLMLNNLKTGLNLKAQRKKLECFPPGLFAVYDQLLEENRHNLDEDEVALRSEIFLFLVGAIEPMTVSDIATALALDCTTNTIDAEDLIFEPKEVILRLCWPLAIVINERVQLFHMSVKEYLLQQPEGSWTKESKKLRLSLEDSNAFLARKTLSKLTQTTYSASNYSASLLRKHLLTGAFITEVEEHSQEGSVFYDYACLHWHEHVTSLSHPSEVVLVKLRQFLTGNEFVTWSEVLFDLKKLIGPDAQVQVRIALQSWVDLLPTRTKEQIPIAAYFILPHQSLNKELEEEGNDKLIPFLPLVRLGEYFNLGGVSREDWQAAYECKKTVAEGYAKVLGGRNPLTLRARTALLLEYFWQTRFDEAERELLEICKIQAEVLGENVIDYYVTLQLLGLAQYYLNMFDDSSRTLQQSEDGLARLSGTSNPEHLMALLYHAYALEAMRMLDQAYHLYGNILQIWIPLKGEDHPLSLMVLCGLGSVLRKRKEFAQAEGILLRVWGARQRRFTLSNNVSIDSAIQLAILYREMQCAEKAIDLLDVISSSSVFEVDFERFCQLTHIRALIEFDAGAYDIPRRSLQHLIDQAAGADRLKNNRELLWIRLTLSDVLRWHGQLDEASMLFADLVELEDDATEGGSPASTSSLDEEPQPPIHFIIAEKALRLVRQAKQTEAENLLHENRLQWTRKRDFWIMQGGPISDTAWMDGPRQAAKHAVETQSGVTPLHAQ
ncbi:hypothetical protein MMC26_004038 [Xylographa opegraphella]|nr:hypothetical protein [Xylographa opegraphella]